MRSFGFLAIVLFSAAVGCDQQNADSLNVVEDVLSPQAPEGRLDIADPEIESVRAWLEENLDEPRWEEVRWYQPLSMGEEDGQMWRMCRIKIRTPDGEGQKLRDLVFYAHGGKIEKAPDDETVYFRDQD